MEYVLLGNTSIKNNRSWDILKRNINQTISNDDESFILSNKRSCVVEEIKPYSKDSIQSLKVHIETEWNFINNDFEHAASTKSITHIPAQRLKPIPIIFHFASENTMDTEKYESDNLIKALSSIYSTGILRK